MFRSLLPGLCLFGLGACVNGGDETVIILSNDEPGEECALNAEGGGLSLTSGLIDSHSVDGYLFTPVVKNYSSATTDEESRRHQAFVQGAHVTIRFNDESLDGAFDESLTRFEVPFSGLVEAGGTSQFTFEIVPIEIIDQIGDSLPEYDPAMPTETELLFASVTLFGEISGGSFETQAYEFPVEICNGCLDLYAGDCTALPSDFESTAAGGHCNPLQDRERLCCSFDGIDICPARHIDPQ